MITKYASETVGKHNWKNIQWNRVKKTVRLLQKCIIKAKQVFFFVMPYYLMQWIIFERLEPYEVKVSRTVLRRGRRREPSSLSDKLYYQKK